LGTAQGVQGLELPVGGRILCASVFCGQKGKQ
jgi:hypothetical protein